MGGEAENLFGEGAGIFWGCACNEGYTTILPVPETKNFLPKKEKKYADKRSKTPQLRQSCPRQTCAHQRADALAA